MAEPQKTETELELNDENDEHVKSTTLNDDHQLEVLESDHAPVSAKTFEELNLSPELLEGIQLMKFTKPSIIQANALPTILTSNKNLIAQAQSGSGKTIAFTLGMLSKIDIKDTKPQALCVCPSRELAKQIYDVVCKVAQKTQIKADLAIPDPSKKGNIVGQVVIGTPGKVASLLQARKLNANNIKVLVLDEADYMIDMEALRNSFEKILLTTKRAQLLLFSATYRQEVFEWAKRLVPHPRDIIRLKKKDIVVAQISQFSLKCANNKKYDAIKDIYGCISVGQSIIFVSAIKEAQQLHKKLTNEKFQTSLIYGKGLEPAERDKIMDDFRNGRTKVLIATDVISRGIDIPQVSLVVNYDPPLIRHPQKTIVDAEQYIHRVGRCSRFGRSGVSVNLIENEEDKKAFELIKKYYPELKIQELTDVLSIKEKMKEIKR